MAKNKSISDLVTDLQAENDRLQFLKKLFDKAVAQEFGHTVKELHKIVEKQNASENQLSKPDLSNVTPDGQSYRPQ